MQKLPQQQDRRMIHVQYVPSAASPHPSPAPDASAKTVLSSPVLPQTQTLLRPQVKAGLQDTTRPQLRDQQHPSLPRESGRIGPYPHLPCQLSRIRASPRGLGPAQFPGATGAT